MIFVRVNFLSLNFRVQSTFTPYFNFFIRMITLFWPLYNSKIDLLISYLSNVMYNTKNSKAVNTMMNATSSRRQYISHSIWNYLIDNLPHFPLFLQPAVDSFEMIKEKGRMHWYFVTANGFQSAVHEIHSLGIVVDDWWFLGALPIVVG